MEIKYNENEYILIKKEEVKIHKEKNNTIYEILPSSFELINDNFENVEVEKIKDNKDKLIRSNWVGRITTTKRKRLKSSSS